MVQATKTAIKGTAIQSPTSDAANHTVVLRQLKEVAEVGQRLRGDPLDSFVRVSELVRAGLVRFTNGTIQGQDSSKAGSATPQSRKILTVNSLVGGGDLTADRTLNLVGDVASPGASRYYGTDASGNRGWYLSAGGGVVTSLSAGFGIAVDATNPAVPIVALTPSVQTSLGLADTSVQAGSLAQVAFDGVIVNRVLQAVSNKAWLATEFRKGINVLAVTFLGPAVVQLPSNLPQGYVIVVKDEAGSGNIVVSIY